MKNLFLLPILFLLTNFYSGNSGFSGQDSDYSGRIPVSCPAPIYVKPAVIESVRTVKDGNWYDPSVWSNGRVPAEIDDVEQSHFLTSRENIIRRGRWKMRAGGIQFLGIDESKFVGGGMDPVKTDVGIWVMDGGQLDWQGEEKTAWTYASKGVGKGATVLTVQSAAGWKVGDVIVIVPMGTPDNEVGYNRETQEATDEFAKQFERRTITGISGSTISFALPLLYDHFEVKATEKTWFPEVANLSRSIVIEGEPKRHAHIFIRSTVSQTIKYVEGRYLGPRMNGVDGRAGGRYGIHAHHMGMASNGSIWEGNAFHDLGNRVFVPHVSHGITVRNNVTLATYGAAMWWDIQSLSHNTTYDGNLVMDVKYDGLNNGHEAILLGMGDNNKAINNTVVYGHKRDPHNNGDYSWTTANEGLWIFENNKSHSSVSAAFVWQSSKEPHVIKNFEAFNNILSWFHGAYFNAYNFEGGYFYSTTFEEKAGSLNTLGVQMKDMTFDKTLLDFLPFPGQSSLNAPVRVINPRLINGSSIRMNAFTIAGENPAKIVQLINYEGPEPTFSRENIPASYFMIQDRQGRARKLTMSGSTSIPSFAPLQYGTGTGLQGAYWNNPSLSGMPSLKRNEPALHYDGWGEGDRIKLYNTDLMGLQPVAFTNHHLIYAKEFSGRFVGMVEAQYSEPYIFRISGSVGSRVWLDDKLIIDSWGDKEDWYSNASSLPIPLVSGKKYKLRIEIVNTNNKAQIALEWKSSSMIDQLIIPHYQLYPDTTATPPPVNRPPISSAGPDRELILPDSILKIEGIATDPDNNLKSAVWSGGVEIKQNLSEISHAMVKVTKAGIYPLTLTVTDQAGLTVTDQMNLIVKPAPVITYYSKAVQGTFTKTCPTGQKGSQVVYKVPDSFFVSTVSQSTADALAQKRILDSGQVYANRVGTCVSSTTNIKPVVNVGENITVAQGVTVTATASDADGTISTYLWTKISGPLSPLIETPNNKTTRISGLRTGTYVFRCTVRDNKSATSYDDITIKVN